MADHPVLFRDRLSTVLSYSVFALLLFFVSFAVLMAAKKRERNQLPSVQTGQPAENAPRLLVHGHEDLEIHREGSLTYQLIRFALYAAALVLVALRLRIGENVQGSFFSYMIGKQWSRDLNIFAISYVLFLTVIIMAILRAAGRTVELVSSSLNPGLETVVRLILSVIKYAGIMVLLFYSLQMPGVQTGTVITFGGIITGVIGLGANSLISDIIAGLFIIFEREFRVNDIVVIDNFKGVVRSIGIRTTRVQDSGGNVKTFNNSRINGVLNLTENYSKAYITMNISLDVPVEKVEKLVNEELTARLAGNTEIVEGPWFSGIMEIRNGFYTISVGARCEQQNHWTVKGEMSKELLKLFKENEVTIK